VPLQALGVRCKKKDCEHFCRLQFLDREETANHLQVLPKESWPLAFVCILCGTVSEHPVEDIRMAVVEKQGLGQFPGTTRIHRMRFQCAQESCGSLIEMYTEADFYDKESIVLERTFRWRISRSCREGHAPVLLNGGSFRTGAFVAEVSPSGSSKK
jgi:hypothetical protein